ncbi:protein-associating with the carboxyl-terminal domain of ezrin isoform X2 [Saccopteryx leptura]|uniref:protein-associating with the carboxyl-terminal domain of ezrin isoform X2 n=1 Tax=Saccopteryx leptura TaxID=249018 RepID=UPI00339D2450
MSFCQICDFGEGLPRPPAQGMGAESSALKGCTLKGPQVTLPSGVAVFPAELQDGRVASVFVYERENADRVDKAAKHLKTLRHPCLLRFLSCTVEADGIHLVTERVQPLEAALETLSPAEVCAGIYDILLALIFLHDRGHLTHNNVCVSSVFVSEDGHWKLGGMETVCRVPQATPEFLRSVQSLRDPACVPPEETSPEFTTLPESHGHARDAYSFGKLVERVFTVLSGQVSAAALGRFQQTWPSALLDPAPQSRPPLRALLSHDFFRNDFLEVVNFLKSLTLKSEEEKTEFFKFLLDRVSCLSEELIAARLVPLLLNQLVFAEPVAVRSFLPHLLGPKKEGAPEESPRLLSPALFRARVVPVLLRLFAVHEEHVRLVLLSHLEAYVEHFTAEQLQRVVLPQVLLGLRDTSSSIVSVTLHSLAVLVSLLGPEVVVGGERTKIFKRTAPSFTKTADLSPEDSPMHAARNLHQQPAPVPAAPTGCFSSDRPGDSKQRGQRDACRPLAQTGDQLSQPVTSPMNGLADVRNTSDSETFPPSSQTSEEWPDWSEPEESEDRTVTLPVWHPEPCEAARSPVMAQEAAKPGALPTSLPLTEAARQPQETSPAPGVDDPGRAKPPEAASRERRPTAPSELGLGEEFTIQVRRKPVQDPELDWFADMTPDIKPPAAVLLLPDLRTETAAPGRAGLSPGLQFSSKFAAVEVTEGESEGWGDAGELNWGDGSW